MADERRVVTVLFADVTGSTALGEAMDPEDVRALLSRYYTIAKEVVAEHGGTVEKFIGDAVMAVFGLPQAHGDDPQRALSAAIELRDQVRSDAQLGTRLPIRVGVNTGEVVAARETSKGDFLVTGDTVNVAARLQQAAEPWMIVCGERTARDAQSTFKFGAAIDVDARGKSRPIRALPVLARAGRPAPAPRLPLIGRGPDLDQIELVARRAFSEQRPFLVSIIAPAGVGKTRLLEEFLDRLPRLNQHANVAVAQCLPYGQRLTYWPLRAVLFRLIGVADDATAPTVREAIHHWVRDAGAEQPDRLAELLGATVGVVGESESMDRAGLLSAWRTALELASRKAPLVLVFEDLHWSSDSLLDLFEFVMQPRAETPLLMIALTRPELLDRRPAWGGGKRNYVSLSLEPLQDRDIARLVAQMLETSARDVIDRVVQRAEGNPFFAGELARAVAERGTLETLPDTVQATVLARLDLLEPAERRLLQLGAVFGRSFPLSGISALEPSPEDVETVADQLVAKDLVRATGRDQFTFRHILIREVAYQTLTRGGRARYHAAAAAWLEERAAEREDALAELIAYHYREAAALSTSLAAGPGAAIEVKQKAVEWLARAGEVAAAAAASIEASRHLRSAIELAAEEQLPELYERLGDIVESGEASAEAYRTALRLARQCGRPAVQQLRVMAGLLSVSMRAQGSVASRMSQEEMAQLRSEAASTAKSVTDERILARYLAADAFYPFWRFGNANPDEISAADRSARRAIEIGERLDDANLQSAALDALSGNAGVRGAWRESRELSRRRLTLVDRLNMTEKEDAHSMVAWGSIILGDLVDAERVTAAGLAYVQPGQIPGWTMHLVAWRICALNLLGRWDEALTMGERARQLWIESGRISAGYAVRGFMAVIDIARARQDPQLLEDNRAIIDEIVVPFPADSHFKRLAAWSAGDLDTVSRDLAKYPTGAFAPPERAERAINLCLDQGRLPDREVLLRIVEFAQAHEYRLLEAQARRGLGLIDHDEGQFARALILLEACGAVPGVARVKAEHALLTRNRESFEKALDVLEHLGDLDQLQRYETIPVG